LGAGKVCLVRSIDPIVITRKVEDMAIDIERKGKGF
jgi:hypothetical protein